MTLINRIANGPSGTEWLDETQISLGKEAPRATATPFASEPEALRGDRHASPYVASLNGEWKFHWVNHPEKREREFFKRGFDDSAWGSIRVPSNWQTEGYDTPVYTNVTTLSPIRPLPSWKNLPNTTLASAIATP